MDRNFKRALALVLKHEGGFVDHPKDPGGATNKGVTIGTFRAYVKPNGTVADLKKITDAQVATVYRRHYWDAVAGAELPDGVDYAVFDFAVNSGPARAAKTLQKVVGSPQDGKVGPATLKATRTLMPATVIHELCDDRMVFLRRLKTWATFGKGWTRRVTEVRSEALKLAAQPTPENPTIVEKEVTVEVEKQVVPPKVEEKVKEKTGFWGWLTGSSGVGAIGLGWLAGMDWQAVLAGGVILVVVILILVLLRSQIISAVREIKAEVG